MTDKEKTEIKLEDDEVALVMNSKGAVQIYWPEMENEDDVPDNVKFMSAIAVVCTTDEEVIELMWEKFNKLIEEAN